MRCPAAALPAGRQVTSTRTGTPMQATPTGTLHSGKPRAAVRTGSREGISCRPGMAATRGALRPMVPRAAAMRCTSPPANRLSILAHRSASSVASCAHAPFVRAQRCGCWTLAPVGGVACKGWWRTDSPSLVSMPHNGRLQVPAERCASAPHGMRLVCSPAAAQRCRP